MFLVGLYKIEKMAYFMTVLRYYVLCVVLSCIQTYSQNHYLWKLIWILYYDWNLYVKLLTIIL